MVTPQTSGARRLQRTRHGRRRFVAGAATVALVIITTATAGLTISHASRHGSRQPYHSTQAPALQAAPASHAAMPVARTLDAPMVFIASSAEAASDFQAALLHVADGAETAHARVVTQDDVQEVLSENVWREANGLPVVRVVGLAPPMTDP
jgi:hypothetical protein